MGVADVFMMVIAMGGLVGMVAILGQAYQRRLEHKERIAELKGGSPITDQRDATIERLEHRLRVLERIATDNSSKLATQIEDLSESAGVR